MAYNAWAYSCVWRFARSLTFFGYRAFSTSSFITASFPPALNTSSALSRKSGLGMRRARSTDDTISSPYPMADPNSACFRPAASRHILICRPTALSAAAASSSSTRSLLTYEPDAPAKCPDSHAPYRGRCCSG
ncbi:hypothetical protein SUDANB51_03513 [Streptomyces sp. enrichment culture]